MYSALPRLSSTVSMCVSTSGKRTAFSLCSVFALCVRLGVLVPTSYMPKQHEKEAELESIYGRFMLEAIF